MIDKKLSQIGEKWPKRASKLWEKNMKNLEYFQKKKIEKKYWLAPSRPVQNFLKGSTLSKHPGYVPDSDIMFGQLFKKFALLLVA